MPDVTRLAEQIAEAVAAAQRSGAPNTETLALVDAAKVGLGNVSHVTEAPSGKVYGRLSLQAAEAWLSSIGLSVVDGGTRDERTRTYTVTVHVSGSAEIVVDAEDADEAEEYAHSMIADGDALIDLDYDMHVFEKRERKDAA